MRYHKNGEKMRKILLIEDNETIILGLKYSLEQEGFEVDIAKSVKETKKKLEKKLDYKYTTFQISLHTLKRLDHIYLSELEEHDDIYEQ